MTRLILVRHGETEWNRVERFRGRADVPLNATGLAQTEAAARRIHTAWPVNAVYCSPLSRAAMAAQAIVTQFQLRATPLQDRIPLARPAFSLARHFALFHGLSRKTNTSQGAWSMMKRAVWPMEGGPCNGWP